MSCLLYFSALLYTCTVNRFCYCDNIYIQQNITLMEQFKSQWTWSNFDYKRSHRQTQEGHYIVVNLFYPMY